MTSNVVRAAEPPVNTRIQAVDILRGLVMVLMAIDHTRDYIHAGSMAFRPEDLAQATPAIFLTRWITHFCAPAIMFCAGIGVGTEPGSSAIFPPSEPIETRTRLLDIPRHVTRTRTSPTFPISSGTRTAKA